MEARFDAERSGGRVEFEPSHWREKVGVGGDRTRPVETKVTKDFGGEYLQQSDREVGLCIEERRPREAFGRVVRRRKGRTESLHFFI